MYHLLALLTIFIWGSTFVSTKILLDAGLSPSDIFLLRFIIAYFGMVVFCHKQWFCNSMHDELKMAAAGMVGGSLYFIGENTALLYTQAGLVSLLVSTAPLLTALLAKFGQTEEKTGIKLWIGSTIALLGVGFTVTGEGGSNSNPLLGNTLALSAAFCWAVYQIIVKPLSQKYGVDLLTRKVFGYGILTMIPYWIVASPEGFMEEITQELRHPSVIFNILYLGLMASLIGYWLWNIIVEKLGSVVSSNYIYLNPLVTCIFSYFVLGESMTPSMLWGGATILTGIYIAIGANSLKIRLK